MRLGLVIVICLTILLLWYSWFFRYQPLQGSMLLDRWRGEVVNLQGGIINLEEHRQLALERHEQERLQRFESTKKPLPPGASHTVTPEEHIEHIRQMLLEGQGVPEEAP